MKENSVVKISVILTCHNRKEKTILALNSLLDNAIKNNNYEIKQRPTNETVTIGEGTTELIYYYGLKTPQIGNKTLTKQGPEVISHVDEKGTYVITYNTEVDEYIGNAEVTIVDYLPYAIDEEKSDIAGGIYNEEARTITWKETIRNIDTYTNGDKTIDITKTITIVYKNILATDRHINNHVSAVIETTTTSNPITADKDTLVKVEGEVVAHYITSSGDSLAKDETITGLVGDPYTTSEKEFANYKLVKIDGNQTGTIDEDKTEVTYVYYHITSDITNNEVEKTGSEVITSKDGKFYYTIHYQTEIDQYIGDATVTIIDKLPQEINVTESDLAGGIYDQESLTITWTISYKDINTYENDAYQIDETKQLVLVYEDLDPTTDKITNKVIAAVVTDITEKPSTDEAETDIDIKGTVIARYIDDLGNELAKTVTTIGKVGSEYKTEEKDFTDYELILVKGEKTGKYEEGETIVTYIYTKLGKGGDVEPEVEVLPPQTGVDTETNILPFGILSSSIIGLFLLIKKNI